jgi:hypothetical protein
MNGDGLLGMLKKLRLSGLGESLEVRLHEAASSGLNHREFLERLLQDELLVRNSRTMTRRVTAAGFRDQKRLEDFDFTSNSSIKKNRVSDLATCQFIRERRDVLWLGPLGTGKSHLAQALGMSARGQKVSPKHSRRWAERGWKRESWRGKRLAKCREKNGQKREQADVLRRRPEMRRLLAKRAAKQS